MSRYRVRFPELAFPPNSLSAFSDDPRHVSFVKFAGAAAFVYFALYALAYVLGEDSDRFEIRFAGCGIFAIKARRMHRIEHIKPYARFGRFAAAAYKNGCQRHDGNIQFGGD